MIKLTKIGICAIDGIDQYLYQESDSYYLIDSVCGHIVKFECDETSQKKPFSQVIENTIERLSDKLRLSQKNGHKDSVQKE